MTPMTAATVGSAPPIRHAPCLDKGGGDHDMSKQAYRTRIFSKTTARRLALIGVIAPSLLACSRDPPEFDAQTIPYADLALFRQKLIAAGKSYRNIILFILLRQKPKGANRSPCETPGAQRGRFRLRSTGSGFAQHLRD
ncbi:MAG TPA: hypothetical protein VIF61_13705, partial [Methylocystis sp.]